MEDRVGVGNQVFVDADPGQTILASAAWRRDVDLEIWVDSTSDPVRIRLAGTLNGQTSKNLISVVKELVSGGARNFEFHAAVHGSESDVTNIWTELRGISQCLDTRFTWSGQADLGRIATWGESRRQLPPRPS